MIPYWLLFGYFFAGALLSRPSKPPARTPLVLGLLIVTIMVGLRFEVGADWTTYEFLFRYAGHVGLWSALKVGDPGYQFVNWIVKQLGQEIWLTNLICAAIFAWGLNRFARVQRDPWLALVIAMPYLVIVVAMGYTRQAVAIGIIMAGLAALQRGASIVTFTFYVVAAALFHRTAVVALPLVALAADRNKFMNLVVGLAACVLLYDVFLSDSLDQFVKNYIDAEYNSQGAAIRVAMNLVPATIFLFARRRFAFDPHEEKIWRNFSLTAWALLIVLLVSPSSTAVDRLALYVIPLQLAVLSRLPYAFGRPGELRLAVAAYSAIVLFIWLNFAKHAESWLPYRLYGWH